MIKLSLKIKKNQLFKDTRLLRIFYYYSKKEWKSLQIILTETKRE